MKQSKKYVDTIQQTVICRDKKQERIGADQQKKGQSGKSSLPQKRSCSIPCVSFFNNFPGQEVAELCQQNARRDIRDDMLLHGQRADTDGNGHQKRYNPIPFRNLFLSAHPNPAEPAYEAMDGREQIIGGVAGIRQAHKPIKNRSSLNFRANHRGWKEHEAKKADGFPNTVGAKETVAFFLIEFDTDTVVDNPK